MGGLQTCRIRVLFSQKIIPRKKKTIPILFILFLCSFKKGDPLTMPLIPLCFFYGFATKNYCLSFLSSLKSFYLNIITLWICSNFFYDKNKQKKKSFFENSSSLFGLHWWLSWYIICLQCRIHRFDVWVRKILWRRQWLPTQVFLPG